MTNDLLALTCAICADPSKTDAMLVCADHLEEIGDVRAAYMRGQVALRALEPGGDARHAKLRELRALYPAEHPTWLATLEEAGAFESNLTAPSTSWFGA